MRAQSSRALRPSSREPTSASRIALPAYHRHGRSSAGSTPKVRSHPRQRKRRTWITISAAPGRPRTCRVYEPWPTIPSELPGRFAGSWQCGQVGGRRAATEGSRSSETQSSTAIASASTIGTLTQRGRGALGRPDSWRSRPRPISEQGGGAADHGGRRRGDRVRARSAGPSRSRSLGRSAAVARSTASESVTWTRIYALMLRAAEHMPRETLSRSGASTIRWRWFPRTL